MNDDMLSRVRDRMTRARDDLGSVHMRQPASAVLHRTGWGCVRHRLYAAAAGTGADGVPASVTFLGQRNPACRLLGINPGPANESAPRALLGGRASPVRRRQPGNQRKSRTKHGHRPLGHPQRRHLRLAFSKLDGSSSCIFSILGRVALVRVSQQCTGS